MASSLPQSKSVPLNLTTARQHRVSISASRSYQSHLSGPGYLHRVRANSEQVRPSSTKDDLHIPLEDCLADQRARAAGTEFVLLLKQLLTDPASFLLDDLTRIRAGHWRPRVLFTLYCYLSVVFFTLEIYVFCSRRQVLSSWSTDVSGPSDVDSEDTSLMNVAPSQLLSVAFRGLGPRAHLDTFVLRGSDSDLAGPSDLTACLWIEDVHVKHALASAMAWPWGPVSLVVVTTHPPNSTSYDRLVTFWNRAQVTTHTLSAHVLYVPSITGSSANAYLNLARLFASTPRVVLFPDGIPLVLNAPEPRVDVGVGAARGPILLNNTTMTTETIPFPPGMTLAPVVLPTNYSAWCTERHYLFGSRALDWDDCLWGLWLESAGGISTVVVPGLWNEFESGGTNAPPLVSSHAMRIRLRGSVKYRSEACAFAFKRSQALGSLSRTEKRHVQWRKKFCRETVGPGALNNS